MYPKRTPPDACNTPKTDMKTRTYAARNGYKLKESCHIPPPQDKTKNILEQTQERHRLRKSSFQSSQKRQPFQQNCALHKWKYRPFMTLHLKKIDDHRRGKWASCLRYMGSMGAMGFSITIRACTQFHRLQGCDSCWSQNSLGPKSILFIFGR